MPQLNALTHDMYDWSPQIAAQLLEQARDESNTRVAANMFGNDNPRPAKNVGYDHSLSGTGTMAYYVDPQEVKRHYPFAGMQLEREFGPHPVIRLSPDVVEIYARDPEEAEAIIAHEHTHGGQQGKLALKNIYARSKSGEIPLGLMLIEGGVEWALERRGKKAPSRYFERRSSRKPAYSIYRDFVYELEEKYHGILRQIYRAAERGGTRAAMRLIESVPGIENIIEKYATQLSTSQRSRAMAAFSTNAYAA